jgi:hypothetical protein
VGGVARGHDGIEHVRQQLHVVAVRPANDDGYPRQRRRAGLETSRRPAAQRIRLLKKGEHTHIPLQIGNTWHVFQCEELRPLTPPKREKLQPRLIQGLAQAKAAQYIDKLKAVAQVK